MLSFLTLPFLASAALGASHLPRRDFHHHLARDISAIASVTNTTTSANASVDMIAAAYYAGWHGVGNSFYNFTLEDVAWTKYTHLIYAFAVTDPAAPENATLADSDETLLTQFVANAKNNSVKAMLSIGGWTGGRAFSTNVGSEANRTAFVKTVIDLKNKYQLDGIDFDWEYPNDAGIGCNANSPNDTANFLTFLQALRADPDGKDLILSAATPVLPWKDATGSPSTDVSAFSDVLTFITVMNYDVWGSWSTGVGPNAPLNDTCASAANQQGSAVAAVKAWTAAGMPAHQIVLGVASYGHSFTVPPSAAFTSSDDNTLAAYPAFNSTSHPLGDGWDGPQGTDVCGVTDPNPSGNWDYWGLVTEGWVWPNGTARPGIDSRFDECSQTPYVYNKTSQIMVSFDDPTSWKAKGEFIVSSGLRGFNVWEAGGDFKDYLLDAISVATGMADEGDDDCGDDTSSASAVISASISVGLPTGTPVITSVAAAGAPPKSSPTAPSGSDNDSQPPAPAPPAAGKGGVPTAPATQTTKPIAPVLANGGGGAQPSPASAQTSSAAPAAPTDDGEGDDDDDCDDDGEGDETSSVSAPASTPSPVNNSGSGGDGDDDCDDDEPSTTPAAPTSAVVSSAVPTPVITSSAAAPSASSTDGDGDDCDDDSSSSASAASTSVAPSSVVSTASASVSTLASASSASSSASASVSTPVSASSASSSASASVLTSLASASSSFDSAVSSAIPSSVSLDSSAASSATPSSVTLDASASSSAAPASSTPASSTPAAESTPAGDASPSSSAASTSVAPTPY